MSSQPPTPPVWVLTAHARQRLAERSITGGELREALLRPDVTYQQRAYGPYRQVRQSGRIGVIVDTSTGSVITVVFRNRQVWLDTQQMAGSGVAA